MSQNHYKAQIVKFSAYISNENGTVQIPVLTARFSHTMNQFPVVELTAQLDNARIKNLGLNIPDFVTLAKDTQSYLINKFRLFADLQVLVEDGQGAGLTFKGFMSNPTFTFQSGLLMLTYVGVHAMSALQGFNPNIYDIIPYWSNTSLNPMVVTSAGENAQVDVSTALETVKFKNAQSIADRLKAIVQLTMNNFEAKLQGHDIANTWLADLASIHKINKTIFANYVSKFLDASIPTTVITGMIPPGDEKRLPSQYITELADNELKRLLFSRENFAGMLSDVCDEFRFQLNADWTGNAWLEPLQMYLDPGQKMIQAPLKSITFNVSNTYELPLLKVYMYLPQGDYYSFLTLVPGTSPTWTVLDVTQAAQLARQATSENQTTGQALETNSPSLISYPNTPVNPAALGVFYIVTPPPWIVPDVALQGNLPDTQDTAALSPAAGVAKIADSKAKNALITNINKTMAQQIVEDTFNERFLGSSGASLSLPFCAPIQPGYTYKVNDTQGNLIFTGYLAGVSHVISQQEGSVELMTNCTFSHIQVNGVNFKAAATANVLPS